MAFPRVLLSAGITLWSSCTRLKQVVQSGKIWQLCLAWWSVTGSFSLLWSSFQRTLGQNCVPNSLTHWWPTSRLEVQQSGIRFDLCQSNHLLLTTLSLYDISRFPCQVSLGKPTPEQHHTQPDIHDFLSSHASWTRLTFARSWAYCESEKPVRSWRCENSNQWVDWILSQIGL